MLSSLLLTVRIPSISSVEQCSVKLYSFIMLSHTLHISSQLVEFSSLHTDFVRLQVFMKLFSRIVCEHFSNINDTNFTVAHDFKTKYCCSWSASKQMPEKNILCNRSGGVRKGVLRSTCTNHQNIIAFNRQQGRFCQLPCSNFSLQVFKCQYQNENKQTMQQTVAEILKEKLHNKHYRKQKFCIPGRGVILVFSFSVFRN